MAGYAEVDRTGAFISNSVPYSRWFATWQRTSGMAYLLLTVKTGYSDTTKSARVLVNGQNVGEIRPRLWTNHSNIQEEAIVLPFSGNVLNLFFPGMGLNNLQVLPTGQALDNYVLLSAAICHYQQS